MSGKAEVNMQQDKLTIQGVVKDEEGEPIPGASVVLKGMTNVGTITDIEGNFSLSYPASEKKPELVGQLCGHGHTDGEYCRKEVDSHQASFGD